MVEKADSGGNIDGLSHSRPWGTVQVESNIDLGLIGLAGDGGLPGGHDGNSQGRWSTSHAVTTPLSAHGLYFYSPENHRPPPCRVSPTFLLRALMSFFPPIFLLLLPQTRAKSGGGTRSAVDPGQSFPPVFQVPLPYAASTRPGYPKASSVSRVHILARPGPPSYACTT